jgi:Cft2 family RNA processing exonuclease
VIQWECLPLNVGHHQEGICLQVRLSDRAQNDLSNQWLMLDCSITDPANILANPPFAAFCSHAHSDHSSGAAQLHQLLPQIPIYTSEVTAQLLSPTYGEIFTPLPWRSPTEILPNLWLEILPAGHIPGAASLCLSQDISNRAFTLMYTGDFFLSNSRLVDGLSLEDFRARSPDVLILEGSLGIAQHPHRRSQENRLVNRILEAIADSQSVLLPLSPLGMAQEILMLLRSHNKLTGKNLDIWVDPAIAQICDRYLTFLPHLPASIQNFAQHQSLFWDRKIRPRVNRLTSTSLAKFPAIVLADQTTDWQDIPQQLGGSWLILLSDSPTNRDRPYETYPIDTHSDVAGTTQLIHNLKPQHLVFIHGQLPHLLDLANLDCLSSRYHVHCPSPGQILELLIGRSLHRPKRQIKSQYSYGGELYERESAVTLALPAQITADPQWHSFADTGLIEAKWQGENLVIRGISPKEILSGQLPTAMPSYFDNLSTLNQDLNEETENQVDR